MVKIMTSDSFDSKCLQQTSAFTDVITTGWATLNWTVFDS